jgi:DNA polymerase III subunit gamma/tau
MSLYNKYRPQSFGEVIGLHQTLAASFLQTKIGNGHLPQAILFSGPTGTGKTTLARITAAGLNCHRFDPCGTCDSCKAILEKDNYTLIDAAVDTGVDGMREVLEKLSLPSLILRKKIVIFDEMHRLSKAAQEALLTTVENPPNNVWIFFCTTEPGKVITTLKTRCVNIALELPNRHEILSYLERIAKLEGSSFSKQEIDNRLPGYTSVRDAVCKLEIILSGGIVENDSTKEEEVPYRVLARHIANRTIPTNVEQFRLLLKEVSRDEGARAAIVEYLHACILKNLGSKEQTEKIRWWSKTIKELSMSPTNSLPGVNTVDYLNILREGASK